MNKTLRHVTCDGLNFERPLGISGSTWMGERVAPRLAVCLSLVIVLMLAALVNEDRAEVGIELSNLTYLYTTLYSVAPLRHSFHYVNS